jgi:sodium/potassium-transporting ATPase subunit alpha
MVLCVSDLVNQVSIVNITTTLRRLTKLVVHERSILSLKKKALRRTKTMKRDPETNEAIRPSKLSMYAAKLRKPFTRVFWEDMFEKTDNETLIDWKVLSYSYIEAGLIETFGS